MQQLSKRTQYSLRALYGLARKYSGGPVLIASLAEEEAIPNKFLEQILLSLKSLGLVSSKKGKGGGYRLAQPPHETTLASVIRRAEMAEQKAGGTDVRDLSAVFWRREGTSL